MELERLQKMRTMLSQLKDKEVIAPPIFVGENKVAPAMECAIS